MHGQIQPDDSRGRSVTVGNMKIQAGVSSIASVQAFAEGSTLSNETSFNDVIITSDGSFDIALSALNQNTASNNFTWDPNLRYRQRFVPDGVRLGAEATFLTIIRSVARIAQDDSEDKIEAFEHGDEELGVEVNAYRIRGTAKRVDWGSIAGALALMSKIMVEQRKIGEMDGFYYEADGKGGEEVFARVSVMKYARPGGEAKVL